MKELLFVKLLNKAAAYCTSAERCRSEVAEKLRQWGMSGEESEAVIEKLERERFIDERRYAQAYVHDKFNYNKWGRRKISLMLFAKGIADDIVEEALQTIDDEAYEETLYRLLEAKLGIMKWSDTRERNAKLVRYAAGRGFESSLIYEVLKRF